MAEIGETAPLEISPLAKETYDTREVITITESDLVDILSRPNFRKAMSAAAGGTREEGAETWFGVEILGNKRTVIPEVLIGSEDSMLDNETYEYIDGDYATVDGKAYFELPNAHLIGIHFHPYEEREGVIQPSETDLLHFVGNNEGQTIDHFAGIGHLNAEGDVDLLLMAPRYPLKESDLSGYFFALRNFAREAGISVRQLTQKDMMAVLSKIGIESRFFRYPLKNSRLELREHLATSLKGLEDTSVLLAINE